MKSTFETLEVWIRGREFRKKISDLTKKFPAEEKYKLVDRMIRASRSVTANIAEGYGRLRKVSFSGKYSILQASKGGSLYELMDHITVGLDEKYIDQELYETFKTEIIGIIKLLNGYIKYLKDRKENDGK